ncbi:hypothetical protein KKF91_04580, partial [Myxococcota bacterium]|nr:hypothetical protein [Myxococcota bacterium]
MRDRSVPEATRQHHLDALRRAFATTPNPTTFAALVEGLLEAHALSEAYDVARRVVHSRPRDLHARILLCEILFQRGDHRACTQELVRILNQDSNHVPALTLLARTLLASGQHEEARVVLIRAQGLAPTSPKIVELLHEAQSRGAFDVFSDATAEQPSPAHLMAQAAGRPPALNASAKRLQGVVRANLEGSSEQGARAPSSAFVDDHPSIIIEHSYASEIVDIPSQEEPPPSALEARRYSPDGLPATASGIATPDAQRHEGMLAYAHEGGEAGGDGVDRTRPMSAPPMEMFFKSADPWAQAEPPPTTDLPVPPPSLDPAEAHAGDFDEDGLEVTAAEVSGQLVDPRWAAAQRRGAESSLDLPEFEWERTVAEEPIEAPPPPPASAPQPRAPQPRAAPAARAKTSGVSSKIAAPQQASSPAPVFPKAPPPAPKASPAPASASPAPRYGVLRKPQPASEPPTAQGPPPVMEINAKPPSPQGGPAPVDLLSIPFDPKEFEGLPPAHPPAKPPPVPEDMRDEAMVNETVDFARLAPKGPAEEPETVDFARFQQRAAPFGAGPKAVNPNKVGPSRSLEPAPIEGSRVAPDGPRAARPAGPRAVVFGPPNPRAANPRAAPPA